MKLPARYLHLDLANPPFGLNLDAEGHPLAWPADYLYPVYPPGGFLATDNLFALGNGDYYGFYWPIGREAGKPLLCELWHDSGWLNPEASNLENLVKLKLLIGKFTPRMHGVGEFEGNEEDDYGYEGNYEYALTLAAKLGVERPAALSESPPDINERLNADPGSPALLLEAAQAEIEAGDLEQAEAHLVKALGILPEFTAAIFNLALLYRRTRRPLQAALMMLQTLCSPLCFGGTREQAEKALHWLRRMRDDHFPELAEEPLWRERHNLTLLTGVKRNDDFAIYERAISEYLAQGKGELAIRLRIRTGELLWSEAVAFRERYGYGTSMEKYIALLRENLQAAGLEARLPTLDRTVNQY